MEQKYITYRPENLRLSAEHQEWMTAHYWEILDSIRNGTDLAVPHRRSDIIRQIRWATLAATAESVSKRYYRKPTRNYDVSVSRIIELHDFIRSFPPDVPIQSIIYAYRMRFPNLEFRRSIRNLGFTLDGKANNVSTEIKNYQKIAEVINRLSAHGIDIETETILCAIDESGTPLKPKQLKKWRDAINEYITIRKIAHPLSI